eukprot:6087188-Pyramimonas_sp.AAC.1
MSVGDAGPPLPRLIGPAGVPEASAVRTAAEEAVAPLLSARKQPSYIIPCIIHPRHFLLQENVSAMAPVPRILLQ